MWSFAPGRAVKTIANAHKTAPMQTEAIDWRKVRPTAMREEPIDLDVVSNRHCMSQLPTILPG
jgi:hypothetical protein